MYSAIRDITRSPKSKHLIGNGGSLTPRYKAQVPGYHQQDVWFCKKAPVTNIIGLRNLTNQIFVVYRSPYGLPARR
jgi:hypothetical protein